uniref:Signal transducing adapter molecule 1-like n=1 Tax=Hirondellea gigas TaxID=1518452 RepID=A0A2P2HY17_9CRUS
MNLFSSSATPLDPHIDRATSDKNTSDDWAVILDVCDRVKEYNDGPKHCIRGISKKMLNDNPRISMQAITLLDSCVNNCGRTFLLEVASREFEQELRKIITSPRTHPKVSEKLRKCLKSWAEGEFKTDRQLSLIPALYSKLKAEGIDFSSSSDSPKKKKQEYSTDPNVVNNKQEEDDMAQAIQMSLQSSSSSKSQSSYNTTSRTLYPSDISNDLASSLDAGLVLSDSKGAANSSSGAGAASNAQDAVKKARALYDFEAAEDNELTFQAGELIVVIDSSDQHWWKGSNHRGEGLFPANFVTVDIHGEQNQGHHRNEKRVSFSEMVKVTEVEDGGAAATGGEEAEVAPVEVTGEVDEEKINFLLHLLHEADPTGDRPDDPQLPRIEEQVAAMAPTIDAELEQIDRRHNELSKLNVQLMQGLNLYHQLMREMPVNSIGGYYPAPYGPHPPMHDPATAAQMMPPPPHQQMIPGYQPYPGMPMMGPVGAPPPQIHQQHAPPPGVNPYPPGMGMSPVTMDMNGSMQPAPPQTTTGPLYHPAPPPAAAAAGNSQDSTCASSNSNVIDATSSNGSSSNNTTSNVTSMLPSYGHFPDAGPPPPPQYNLPPQQQQQHYQQQMPAAPQLNQQQQAPPQVVGQPIYSTIPLHHHQPPAAPTTAISYPQPLL